MKALRFLPAVTLILLGLAMTAPRGLAADEARPAMLVKVEPVRWSGDPIPVEASGTIRRKVEADLSFKVGGLVAEVGVRAGDVVRKGQRLAVLKTDEIDSKVGQAKARHDQAVRDLARMEALAASKAVSVEAKESAATAVEVAAAALKAAGFDQTHAVIEAPEDGRILQRFAEPDEMVSPGQTVLSFASESEGWLVTINLAERDAARVRPGDKAEVRLNALGGDAMQGQVTQIAESTDAATRTVKTEIRVPRMPAGARSGFLASAHIQPAPVSPRPVVPLSALVEGSGTSAHVFLLEKDGQHASRVAVEIAEIAPEVAYLRGDLEKGRLLVVSGAEFLRDGAPVRVQESKVAAR